MKYSEDSSTLFTLFDQQIRIHERTKNYGYILNENFFFGPPQDVGYRTVGVEHGQMWRKEKRCFREGVVFNCMA